MNNDVYVEAHCQARPKYAIVSCSVSPAGPSNDPNKCQACVNESCGSWALVLAQVIIVLLVAVAVLMSMLQQGRVITIVLLAAQLAMVLQHARLISVV